MNFSKEFQAKEKNKLSKIATSYQGNIKKEQGISLLEKEKQKLSDFQEVLYADNKQSLLIIVQAMDAAGKDSLIKHVMSGVNPQGCSVTSFKTPTSNEYQHDFLWRHEIKLPEKGQIGIFNRSHYENVLVCKVHPEYNLKEKVWNSTKDFGKEFWEDRYQSILDFEKHLSKNGTKIIKFFLHVSKDEQKKRFLQRIEQQDKNWKFSSADLNERALWDEYQKAYEQLLDKTSTSDSPWYILPADNKWFTRLAASNIINETLEDMKLSFPELSKEQKADLEKAKQQLLSE